MSPRCRLLSWSSIAFLLLLSASAVASDSERFRVKVFSRDTATLIQELEQGGFDVLGRNWREGFVEAIVTAEELDLLRLRGMEIEVVESSAARGGRSVPPEYRDWPEHQAELLATVSGYPEIAMLIDAGAAYGVGNTHENRKIYVVKISDNVEFQEDEPNILLTFNRHARELTTGEYALWVLEKLTVLYGTDPDVTHWVDHNQIYIMSCMNPDGMQYCHDQDDWWRKNRSPQDYGYFGVDVNRNYDFNWDGPYGGSSYPGDITYRGPYAHSEQEVRCEAALAEDLGFAKVMDFHSYGRELLYSYASASSFPPLMEAYMEEMATDIADGFNYAGEHRKPSAEGESYEWELNRCCSFSFLVETGTSFIPSYATAQSEWTNYIWPGVQYFLDVQIPLRGHVVEADTGAPIEADIAVAGINYLEGEVRRSEPRFGAFSYFLPAGTYDVTFSAAGYAPKTVTVKISSRESTLLEVQLGTGPALTVNGVASPGGGLDLDFDWPAGAGQTYWNGVSLTNAGFHFNSGVFMPIGWDFLFWITVGKLPGWKGTLDGSGHGSADLPIPQDPLLAGLTVFMAYFTQDPVSSAITASSGAARILIE